MFPEFRVSNLGSDSLSSQPLRGYAIAFLKADRKTGFYFTKTTRGHFIFSPSFPGAPLLLLSPLEPPSWHSAPWPPSLLVLLGGGEGAVGHQVASALAPAGTDLACLTSGFVVFTNLWQVLAPLGSPLLPT